MVNCLSAPSNTLREYGEMVAVFVIHLLFYWMSRLTGQVIFFVGGGFSLLLIMEVVLFARLNSFCSNFHFNQFTPFQPQC